MPFTRRAPRLAALTTLAALAATACGAPAPSPAATGGPAPAAPGARPIPVVAAENFYGDVIAQVCGSRCTVTSLLSDPNADPHEYESNAQDALAVARARLVVENGLGYDTFMADLLSAAPAPARRVIDVQTLLGVADGANPHLWYDPNTMPTVAQTVAGDLAALDPADAVAFRAGAAAFIASLQPMNAEIASIRQAFPGAPAAYTEPVFGYMGQALGLDVRTPAAFEQAIEDGDDPPASALAAQESLLSGHGVKVLLYNVQTVTPLTTQVEDLARADGVPVVGVSETEPVDTTYQQWMLQQLQALAAALGGGGARGA